MAHRIETVKLKRKHAIPRNVKIHYDNENSLDDWNRRHFRLKYHRINRIVHCAKNNNLKAPARTNEIKILILILPVTGFLLAVVCSKPILFQRILNIATRFFVFYLLIEIAIKFSVSTPNLHSFCIFHCLRSIYIGDMCAPDSTRAEKTCTHTWVSVFPT